MVSKLPSTWPEDQLSTRPFGDAVLDSVNFDFENGGGGQYYADLVGKLLEISGGRNCTERQPHNVHYRISPSRLCFLMDFLIRFGLSSIKVRFANLALETLLTSRDRGSGGLLL